jgi:hypothetical protein
MRRKLQAVIDAPIFWFGIGWVAGIILVYGFIK